MTQAIYSKDRKDAASMEINMKLGINRDYPTAAKKIEHTDSRKLNFNQLHDCLAGRNLMPTENKYDTDHGFFNIKK